MSGSAVGPHQANKVFRRIRKRERQFPVGCSLTLGFNISESPGLKQDANALLKLFAVERLPFLDRKHVSQHLLVVLIYAGKVDLLDGFSDAASLLLGYTL